jgi:Tol biopolymer transport system component
VVAAAVTVLAAAVCSGAAGGAGAVIEQSDYGPVYSPDGTQIAFRRIPTGFYGGAPTPHAFVMPAGGGEARDLGPMFPLGTGQDSLAWTPDGTEVVYGSDVVKAARVDGGGIRTVGAGSLDTSAAPMSRDGWLAFTGGPRVDAPVLGLMRLDGSDRRVLLGRDDPRLALPGGADRRFSSPTFSPDGRTIAFVYGDAIWTVERSGTELKRVDAGPVPGYGAILSWSPDGRRLAYVARDGVRIADAGGVRLVSAEGLGITFGSVSWSPDASRLLVPTRSGYGIVSADGATGPRLDVAPPAADGGRYSSWSPDGATIAIDESVRGCRTGSLALTRPALDSLEVLTSDCRIVGTPRADTIVGTELSDVIRALGGSDRVFGGAGNDTIDGGPGNDVLHSDARGGTLDGGDGNDTLLAEKGDDLLIGGRGRDVIRAGAGQDRIVARDGFQDVVDCGPGVDRATVDRFDVVRGCETVRPLRRR